MTLPAGRFEGRLQFAQWLRDALAAAAAEGWRELWLSDPDFADWPLGERAVVDTLAAWARPGRRCVLLAAGYGEVVRRHARFVRWRVEHAHLLECHACRLPDPASLPSALCGPAWSLRRLDLAHSSGWAGAEPQRRTQLQELLVDWQRRSAPAFPASVLGL